MADQMTESTPAARLASGRTWAVRALAVLSVAVCLTVATGFWVMRKGPGDEPIPSPGGTNTAPTATPSAGEGLFAGWPQQKPEFVMVLTGQSYGYLFPCGCSRPQKGGLERRANFIDELKKKGWTAVGLDLGDAAPAKGLAQQNLFKYRATMKALAAMDYAAIGLGEYDFSQQLFNLLAEYSLSNPNKRPIVLAGNLVGAQRDANGAVVKKFPREEIFPGGGPNARPMVEAFEVIAEKGTPTIGVIGVIGPDVAKKAVAVDKTFDFSDRNPAGDAISGPTIANAIQKMNAMPTKPQLLALLYQGTLEQAKIAADAVKDFRLIVCLSDESEPPQFPTLVNDGKTMIVQVGHKGKSVGAVGVFKNANGDYDLKYQLVPLGEEYLTPTDKDPVKNAAIEKNHKVLSILERYAADVQKQNLIAVARTKPLMHPAQIQHQKDKLTYVGADKCAQCHAAEYAVWKGTKHPHGYESLETAKRPSLRQFDPECIVCHTTGFEFVGGFEDATKSAFLKGNQCENCHGPGSAHSAKPNDKAFYPALTAWKSNPKDKLPSLEFIKKMAAMKPLERNQVAVPANEKQVVNAVSGMCMKCHDVENDPNFDFYEYFPKIYHSGLKNAGLPVGAK